MKYREYGQENLAPIIFLHGGGLSWWNYKEEAEKLQDRYHVVIPILDGHSGSDRQFTTIEDNAEEIITYIDEHFGGKVLLMGGLSLGGQVLLEILSRRSGICSYAIIESTMVVASPFTHALIRPVFGSGHGLIKHRWFSKWQFKSLHIKRDLFENYYKDTGGIKKKDMIAFLQASTEYILKDSIRDCVAGIHIYIGQKETRGIKKSATQIQELIPNAVLTILQGMYHGEFSINHAEDYVKTIESILNGECVVAVR